MNERDDFERRLREARTRQGLDKPAEDAKGGLPPGPMGIGFRVGVELVAHERRDVALGAGVQLDGERDRIFQVVANEAARATATA